jgi:hypothetical protein
MTLTIEEMGKLVVAGTGSDIKAKLEDCGAMGGEVCAAVIVSVEGGPGEGGPGEGVEMDPGG